MAEMSTRKLRMSEAQNRDIDEMMKATGMGFSDLTRAAYELYFRQHGRKFTRDESHVGHGRSKKSKPKVV